MPPKTGWKTLSRVATSPFRRSDSKKGSGSGGSDSRGPSRKNSFDIPRTDSPPPVEREGRPQVAQYATEPGPPPSNPLPLSNPEQGALDLASPIEQSTTDLGNALADEEGGGPVSGGGGAEARDVAQGMMPQPMVIPPPPAPPAVENPPEVYKPAVEEQQADLGAAVDDDDGARPGAANDAHDVGAGYGGGGGGGGFSAAVMPQPQQNHLVGPPFPVPVLAPTPAANPNAVDVGSGYGGGAAPAKVDYPDTPQTHKKELDAAPVPHEAIVSTTTTTVLPIDQAIADHAGDDAHDISVSISSGPVEGKDIGKLEVVKPVKGSVMTPETTPADSHPRDGSEAPEESADVIVTRITQIEHQAPISAMTSTFTRETTPPPPAHERDDPFDDGSVAAATAARLISPPQIHHHHAGAPEFPRPYTIPAVFPASGVDETDVEGVDADDEGGNDSFMASSTRAILETHQQRDQMAMPVAHPHLPGGGYKVDDDEELLMDLTRWTSFTLPIPGRKDVYFHHSEARIVTDVDITSDAQNLSRIAEHLVQRKHHHHYRHRHHLTEEAAHLRFGHINATSEIWVRFGGGKKGQDVFVLWVDHEARVVKGAGDGEEDDVVARALYWEFMESHPAHVALPESSAEEAAEAVSWCYSDTLLNPYTPTKRAFSLSESRELVDLLRTSEIQNPGALQTHVIAQIQVRLAKCEMEGGAKVQMHRRWTSSKAGHEKKPFGNVLGRMFVVLFCFGVPYKYVDYGLVEEDSRCFVDSAVFTAGVTLMATMLITASSVLLVSLPALGEASALAATVSLLLACASLLAGVVALKRRASPSSETRSLLRPGHAKIKHPFVRSLPLVLNVWSVVGIVAAVILWAFQVQFDDEDGMLFKWIVVGVSGWLMLVLLGAMISARRR